MSVVATPDTADAGLREPRHRAREAAIQLLYRWEVGGLSADTAPEAFWAQVGEQAEGLSPEAREFATALAAGTAAAVGELDPLIAEAADNWRLERMNVLDRLVLRLAAYELRHDPDIPARVVINEALELARAFGGDDSVRFVNGVLDAVVRRMERA